MKYMYDLKDMLCEELETIARKGELTAGDLETTHKLTDTIKNIDKILMLEDSVYSRNDGYSMGDEYSMTGRNGHGGAWEARGSYNNGHSYARRRDSMGRYSRDGGKPVLDEMKSMMRDADPKYREIMRKAVEEMERMM